MADEQLWIYKFRREVGVVMVMDSNTDSITSLPEISSKISNEMGSSRKATLLLSHITKFLMARALGREEARWSHLSISIVSKVGKSPRNLGQFLIIRNFSIGKQTSDPRG